MKIIISHDVDHLFTKDHLLRDLIIPKLWIRSSLNFMKRKISFSTWLQHLGIIFQKRWHRIDEIMIFDKKHLIPSVFFFGMNNMLGMSYKQKEVISVMRKVMKQGFDVGVHGIEIDNIDKIKKEFDDFSKISELDSFGIRTHYVRYNKITFQKFNQAGYLFDSSEFNKKEITLKAPYKIGSMWEFPLYIMDSYILVNGFEEAKKNTLKAFDGAEIKKLEFFTFLFHDHLFNEKTEPTAKAYYEWFINECERRNYVFISYRKAIQELENKKIYI